MLLKIARILFSIAILFLFCSAYCFTGITEPDGSLLISIALGAIGLIAFVVSYILTYIHDAIKQEERYYKRQLNKELKKRVNHND